MRTTQRFSHSRVDGGKRTKLNCHSQFDMTIDVDSESLSTTKSVITEDPTISDSRNVSSPEHQCEVSLGKDELEIGNQNNYEVDDDPTRNGGNPMVLDADLSVECQSEVSPWKIENENGDCDNVSDAQTTDDPFISNSDPFVYKCTSSPSNKETNYGSDEQEVAQEDKEEEWPEAFYCQRTHILMTDPLVGPDGCSIDSSVVDKEDPTIYYPNRALQAIVHETISLRKHPFRAGLKHLQQSVSHGISNLLQDWNSNESLFRPLNDAFYCPITYNLMHQPVIDPEGNTFERVAVENWIRINQSSPITRTDLSIDQLYPNTALEKLLQEETERPEDQMHPAIRKWKEEPMPRATDVELGGRAVLEHERRRNRRDGQNSTLIVITRPHGGSSVFYPVTYQQLLLRRENSCRARYRFFAYLFAGSFLMTFVVNEHLVFLLLFLLCLLFVFFKRPIHNM